MYFPSSIHRQDENVDVFAYLISLLKKELFILIITDVIQISVLLELRFQQQFVTRN